MPDPSFGVQILLRGRRLQRLLQIIALLKGPTAYNARKLADHFNTSRRNAYRDIAVLELANVPIFYDAAFGESGGYRIRSDFWFPTMTLTDGECIALAMMSKIAEDHGIPLVSDLASIRDKLLSCLPAHQENLIATLTRSCLVTPASTGSIKKCRQVMPAILKAITSGTCIKATCKSPGVAASKRVILQPMQLVFKNMEWLLLARKYGSGQTKSYPLEQLENVEISSPSDRSKMPKRKS